MIINKAENCGSQLAFLGCCGYNDANLLLKENLSMIANLFENPLFQDVCRSVIILIVGIFAMRIIRRLLKTTLERSRLEKAAHSLITSLAGAAMYILLGLMVASSLGIDVTSIVALDATISPRIWYPTSWADLPSCIPTLSIPVTMWRSPVRAAR